MNVKLDSSQASEHRWVLEADEPLTQGPLVSERFAAEELRRLHADGTLTESGARLVFALGYVKGFVLHFDEDERGNLTLEVTSFDPQLVTKFLQSRLHDFSFSETVATGRATAVHW